MKIREYINNYVIPNKPYTKDIRSVNTQKLYDEHKKYLAENNFSLSGYIMSAYYVTKSFV